MFLFLQWTPKPCQSTHEGPALSCHFDSADYCLYFSGFMDYGLLHALQHTRCQTSDSPHPDNATFIKHCDHKFSYDISCGYCINAVQHFKSNPYLQDKATFLRNLDYLIPLVHVQNHKDNCAYLYSSVYVEHAGHFFGETAEHVWPELN